MVRLPKVVYAIDKPEATSSRQYQNQYLEVIPERNTTTDDDDCDNDTSDTSSIVITSAQGYRNEIYVASKSVQVSPRTRDSFSLSTLEIDSIQLFFLVIIKQ
jgi:hypothetical protein